MPLDPRPALASARASARVSPLPQGGSGGGSVNVIAADVAELVERDARQECWVLHNTSGLSSQLRILISAKESTLCLTREPGQSVSATLQRLAGKIRLPEGAQVKLVSAGGEELASVVVPERPRKQKKGDKTAAADAAAAEAAAKSRAEAEAGVEAGLELSNDDAFVDGNTLHLGTEVLRILRQVPVRRALGLLFDGALCVCPSARENVASEGVEAAEGLLPWML